MISQIFLQESVSHNKNGLKHLLLQNNSNNAKNQLANTGNNILDGMIIIINKNNSGKHNKSIKLVFQDIGKSVKIKET